MIGRLEIDALGSTAGHRTQAASGRAVSHRDCVTSNYIVRVMDQMR